MSFYFLWLYTESGQHFQTNVTLETFLLQDKKWSKRLCNTHHTFMTYRHFLNTASRLVFCSLLVTTQHWHFKGSEFKTTDTEMHQQVHSYRQPKYCGCPNTPYGIGDAGDTQTSPKEPEDPVVGHCPHGWPIIYNGFLHDQWVLVVMLCPIIVFRMISRC